MEEFNYNNEDYFNEDDLFEVKTFLGVKLTKVKRDRDKNNNPVGRYYALDANWVYVSTLPSRKHEGNTQNKSY